MKHATATTTADAVPDRFAVAVALHDLHFALDALLDGLVTLAPDHSRWPAPSCALRTAVQQHPAHRRGERHLRDAIARLHEQLPAHLVPELESIEREAMSGLEAASEAGWRVGLAMARRTDGGAA